MRKQFKIRLINDGKLTLFSQLCMLLGGLATVLGALIYSSNKWLMLLGIVAGCFMAAVAGISAKAQILGLKPFTNDPLGWRKAKASYRKKESAEDSAKETSEPIDDDKPK